MALNQRKTTRWTAWVDLLMEHFFPGLKMMQTIKEDISKVDEAFEKNFPDMKAIAQSIGETMS